MTPKKTAPTTTARQGTKKSKQSGTGGNAPGRSSGRSGRPVDADSAATRQAILDGAVVAFGRNGYDGTGLQAIAEHAGLTAATLYHYFPGKAAIFQSVGDEVAGEFRRRTEVVNEGVESSRDQIVGVLRALGEWIIDRPEVASFIATYAAEVANRHEVRRLSPTKRWTEPINYYAAIARRGIERGEIAGDLEPDAVAGLVQGLVYGMCALVAVGRAFGPPELLIDAFIRTTEGSLFMDTA